MEIKYVLVCLFLWSSIIKAASLVPDLKLTWPVPDMKAISQDYAQFHDPSVGNKKFHAGIDIAAPGGSTVIAAETGAVTVFLLDDNEQKTNCLGNVVIIDHGNVATLYAHLSEVNVKTGDVISQGETIGKSGNTAGKFQSGKFCDYTEDDPGDGRIGYHLHFELKDNAVRWGESNTGKKTWSYTPEPGTTALPIPSHHPNAWGYHDPVLNLHSGIIPRHGEAVTVTQLGNGARMRIGPGTQYSDIGYLAKAGESYKLLNEYSVSTAECSGWYEVKKPNNLYFQNTVNSGQLPEVWVCKGTETEDWLKIVPLPGERATVTGVVKFGDQPLCALVLANGQHMFSCDGNGSYNLSVPLDDQDLITLQVFASNFAPYRQVLTPGEASDFTVLMERDTTNRSLEITRNILPGSKPGYVKLSGSVSYDGTPVCALVLANGQNMFSCGDKMGTSDLTEVPLDTDGNLTLFTFASGFAPFRITFPADGDLSLKGSVTDEQTEKGISGARLKVEAVQDSQDSLLTTTTDSLGRYSMYIKSSTLPSHFLFTATADGYVPEVTDIPNIGQPVWIVDFTLRPIDEGIVILELDPKLHHLGDDEFGGSHNSQFQKLSEGLVYEKTFILSAAQASASSSTIQLTAKGLQNNNPLLINGELVGYLNDSASDGSFSNISEPVPMAFLHEGVNTLKIESVETINFDDFEFTNIILEFTIP